MRGVSCSIGTLIVDEIHLPDGSLVSGRAGGGTGHGAMGMRLWEEQTGILTRLGRDHQAQDFPLLDELFLPQGLYRSEDLPTPRFKLLMNPDGSREEVFNIPLERLPETIPDPSEIPGEWEQIAGVHLHCYPSTLPEWVKALRPRGCQSIVWEPWSQFGAPENYTEFLQLGQLADIVSPNIFEARALSGLDDPLQICQSWIKAGFARVLLRLGADGCLAMEQNGTYLHLPAIPIEAVGQTGAGNACCGGAAVGFAHSRNLFFAAAMGNVSASFTLQQYGALYPAAGKCDEMRERLSYYFQMFPNLLA